MAASQAAVQSSHSQRGEDRIGEAHPPHGWWVDISPAVYGSIGDRTSRRMIDAGGMEQTQILQQASDTLTVRRVFGEPIERDGVLVVPVARVRGGAGAGGGEGSSPETETTGRGGGGGWAVEARPVGVFLVAGGDVRWVPALDLNRVIIGGQVVALVGLLVLRSIVRMMRSRRRQG